MISVLDSFIIREGCDAGLDLLGQNTTEFLIVEDDHKIASFVMKELAEAGFAVDRTADEVKMDCVSRWAPLRCSCC